MPRFVPGSRSKTFAVLAMRVVFVVAVVILAAGCEELSGPESPGSGGLEDAVAKLVNDHRQALGCPRLRWREELASVAYAHSEDMRERAYFGHQDPDGHGLADRLRAAGVSYHVAAENIAQGFRYEDAARRVFEAWLKSDGHRRIIESCTFTHHGIGFVDYHWTHLFMR